MTFNRVNHTAKLALLLALPLCLINCKKEQVQMSPFNENCEKSSPVSADFTMEDLAGPINIFFDKRTETDTAYENSGVYFSPKDPDTTGDYTWYIGAEVIKERTFWRQMTGPQLIGLQLPMTLVVKKEPNLICHPDDDGYDSITKYLTLVDFVSYDYYHDPNPLFEGTFRFKDHLKPEQDSIDVEIELKADGEDGAPFNRAVLSGLWHNNTDLVLNEWYINYRQLWFHSGQGYRIQRMRHGMDRTVEIELIAWESLNDPIPEYHLIGRKL